MKKRQIIVAWACSIVALALAPGFARAQSAERYNCQVACAENDPCGSGMPGSATKCIMGGPRQKPAFRFHDCMLACNYKYPNGITELFKPRCQGWGFEHLPECG